VGEEGGRYIPLPSLKKRKKENISNLTMTACTLFKGGAY